MGFIRKQKEKTGDNVVETTAIVIPIKKKTIKRGIVRKSFLGIQYSKKTLSQNDRKLPPKTSDKKKDKIAFFVGCPDGRSERYSVLDICDSLKGKGIETKKIYFPFDVSDEELRTFSLIVFFRLPVCEQYNIQCFDLFHRVQTLNIPCIFSVDDLVFDETIISHYPNFKEWDQETFNNVSIGITGYQNTLLNCDAAFVTSNYLVEKIKSFVNETFMFPCLISERQFKRADKINKTTVRKEKDTIDICYLSGTPSHNNDFLVAENAVHKILKIYPQTRLVLVGPLKLSDKFDDVKSQIVHYDLMPYLDLLDFTAKMDINLAPLEQNNCFTSAKAPTKIVEASIVKVPTVASPIPSYCECVDNGKTGFIAMNDDEWFNSLSLLVENKQLRQEIAHNAYEYAFQHYYIGNRIDEIVDAYKKVISLKGIEKNKYDEFLKTVYDRKEKPFDIHCLDIAFLIPAPIAGGGGHRNIFRAVTYLRKSGHNVTVYYMDSDLPAEVMKKKCSRWFYDMVGINFIKYNGNMGFYDVAVATYWTTAYEIRKKEDHFRYMFYFTQDFEALFNPMSSNYILAENSYRLGFSHICSGPWMHNCITKRYGVKSDYFQFPVDKGVYNTNGIRTKKNKNLVFFAKPEMPRRCFELGIQALEKFHEQRPDVEIILFGSKQVEQDRIPFPCTIKKLLPKITDLADMYRNADFGLVFSTTNPSLIPYEMMACGCPVGDLRYDDPLAKYGNSEDNVFLLDPLPDNMAQELVAIFDNPDLMKEKARCGKDFVDREFPSEEQMGQKFEQIILDGIQANGVVK